MTQEIETKMPDVLYVAINPLHPQKGALYNTSSVPPRPCGVSEVYLRADHVTEVLKQAREEMNHMTDSEYIPYGNNIAFKDVITKIDKLLEETK
jgi:hypothetical protein